jgi:hypothetical protein
MGKATEDYKQQLFEAAAEYGKAGRAAYHELEQHIDEGLEHGAKPKDVIAELGEPEQAIRTILRADGKATYPLTKVAASGALLATGAAVLVGASGLLLPLGSRIAGMRAISGDADVLPYTAARCGEYRHLVPSAHSCREAAQLHHYYELTDGRIMLGVLAVLALLVMWWMVRKGALHVLPRKMLALLGAGVYGALGGVIMLIALGNLSAGRSWEWFGDLLTGVPLAIAGIVLLAYYLGYRAKRS